MFDYAPRYIDADGQPITPRRSRWGGFSGPQPQYQTAPADDSKTKRRSKERKPKSDG